MFAPSKTSNSHCFSRTSPPALAMDDSIVEYEIALSIKIAMSRRTAGFRLILLIDSSGLTEFITQSQAISHNTVSASSPAAKAAVGWI